MHTIDMRHECLCVCACACAREVERLSGESDTERGRWCCRTSGRARVCSRNRRRRDGDGAGIGVPAGSIARGGSAWVRRRSPARTTSLAVWYRPVATCASMKRRRLGVRETVMGSLDGMGLDSSQASGMKSSSRQVRYLNQPAIEAEEVVSALLSASQAGAAGSLG